MSKPGDKKPAPKPVSTTPSKPAQINKGMIGQTGNRPGGTATSSYKHIGESRDKK
jgi:hypothetical protein